MEVSTTYFSLMTEDDHDKEDHHDDDEDHDDHGAEHGAVFRNLSTWNEVLCSLLLITFILIGSTINLINIKSLWRHSSTTANNKILLIASWTYLLAYVCLLPLTLAGVISPAHVVTEKFCYIQETLTLCVIVMGFFFPSMLSVNRMVVVVSGDRKWFSDSYLVIICTFFIGLAIMASLLPIFAVRKPGVAVHEHGCHLWSERIDSAMWYRAYTILVALLLCVFTLIFSYTKLYLRVKSSVKNVDSHRNKSGHMSYPSGNASSYAGTVYFDQEENAVEGGTTRGRYGSTINKGHTVRFSLPTKAISFGRHKRVAQIAFTMVAFYILFWLPWFLITWLSTGSDEAENIPAETRITTMVLGYLPCVSDPILYTLMSPLLKQSMKTDLDKLCSKITCMKQ